MSYRGTITGFLSILLVACSQNSPSVSAEAISVKENSKPVSVSPPTTVTDTKK